MYFTLVDLMLLTVVFMDLLKHHMSGDATSFFIRIEHVYAIVDMMFQ